MRSPSHREAIVNRRVVDKEENDKRIAVLEENVRDLQEQLQKSYIRIKELQEKLNKK